MRVPVYTISLAIALFLMAVLCFLVYEESWRVDGKLCDSLLTVEMESCDEGDTANGYRALCWVLVAIFAVVAAAGICLFPGVPGGLEHLEATSVTRRWQPALHICPIAALVAAVAFYAYFITLLLFQVSCGDYESKSVPILPAGEVERWSFHTAERVLVFFTVGMILWWLSFFAYLVEHVTASLSIQHFLVSNGDQFAHFQKALFDLGKYHLGTVLLASVVLPIGRLPRNVAIGLKSLLQLVLSDNSRIMKCCLCGYTSVFQYMTSTSLALQTLEGTSFLSAAQKARLLLARHAKKSPEKSLNQADRLIWLTQLVVTLIGPVFVAYWIQHESKTFRDRNTSEITSVTAMAIYSLFLTWCLAQLYGCFVRGVVYGFTVAYLTREDAKPKSPLNGEVAVPTSIAADLLNSPTPKEATNTSGVADVEKALVNPPPDVVPPPSPKNEELQGGITDEGHAAQAPDTQWLQS